MPAHLSPRNPPEKEPAQPDPTRHQFTEDPDLGTHDPYRHPDAPNSPSTDDQIKVTSEQLVAWSRLFEEASRKLNAAGDHMTRITVQPGYFQEADTVRDLVSTFVSTFVPNCRILSDSSAYVSRALQLAVKEFDNVEQANLDKNTNLIDLVSSMTKLETGLKAMRPISPNTPSA